jgi:hypothetical protein
MRFWAMRLLTGTIGPLVAAVAACGGDDRMSPFTVAQHADCDVLTEEPTQEIYVLERFACVGPDSETTTVYTFRNAKNLSGWLDVAEGLGVVVVDQGDTWIKVEN